ncbi:MAG TPA: phage protein GemA/Gp16 family protein [Candidatus Bathyarchaeia archaeon]|nr:phage protein GemA/Gp16 family protein [Candidatus Bathyarchaeia archaeon]
MATTAQIKFIHVLIGKLQLLDDHYRDMLAAYNVSSSAAEGFTVVMANELIDCLIKMANERGVDVVSLNAACFKKADVFAYLNNLGSRPGYATYGQLCKIVYLWWEVSVQKTDIGKWEALRTFIKNKWEIDRIEWMPIELVSKVIKTIEAMQKQQVKPQEVPHE